MLGDGWAGIDLDDVVTVGGLGENCTTYEVSSRDATDIANSFATYTEYSPSGTGLKIFGRGEWRADWNKKATTERRRDRGVRIGSLLRSDGQS